MGHEVDWSKFPKPWNRLGPALQTALRRDVTMIVAGRPPVPPPPLPDRWFADIRYPTRFT
jgi:hypothetical protein